MTVHPVARDNGVKTHPLVDLQVFFKFNRNIQFIEWDGATHAGGVEIGDLEIGRGRKEVADCYC